MKYSFKDHLQYYAACENCCISFVALEELCLVITPNVVIWGSGETKLIFGFETNIVCSGKPLLAFVRHGRSNEKIQGF